MKKYTAIADTSQRLVRLLAAELVPDVIRSADGIGLCSPQEHGDMSLGLFLYDIQECGELQQRGMVNTHRDRQAYPPLYLNLFYMITAYWGGDLKFRMAQEERILGGVAQVFHNHALIPVKEGTDNGGMALHVQMQRIPVQEKAQIWNFQGMSYQLSLFYKVSPVMIASGREREVFRVTEAEMGVWPISDTLPGGPGRRA